MYSHLKLIIETDRGNVYLMVKSGDIYISYPDNVQVFNKVVAKITGLSSKEILKSSNCDEKYIVYFTNDTPNFDYSFKLLVDKGYSERQINRNKYRCIATHNRCYLTSEEEKDLYINEFIKLLIIVAKKVGNIQYLSLVHEHVTFDIYSKMEGMYVNGEVKFEENKYYKIRYVEDKTRNYELLTASRKGLFDKPTVIYRFIANNYLVTKDTITLCEQYFK